MFVPRRCKDKINLTSQFTVKFESLTCLNVLNCVCVCFQVQSLQPCSSSSYFFSTLSSGSAWCHRPNCKQQLVFTRFHLIFVDTAISPPGKFEFPLLGNPHLNLNCVLLWLMSLHKRLNKKKKSGDSEFPLRFEIKILVYLCVFCWVTNQNLIMCLPFRKKRKKRVRGPQRSSV